MTTTKSELVKNLPQGPVTSAGPPRGFLPTLLRKPLAVLSLLWLAILGFVSIFARWLTPYDPLQQNLMAIKQGPGSLHLLGTDAFGRDVLSRLLYGTWPTVSGVFIAVGVAMAIGIILGMIAGYFGGRVDQVVGQVSDLILSLPNLVILMSVLAVFQRDMVAAMITLGILGSAGVARVLRSAVMNVREELYVDAARISGLNDTLIIWRHIIPRTMGPLIVQLSLFATVAVITQTGISFLGLGVQPPAPTWGGMVYEASQSLSDHPWLLVPSGVSIAITALAFGLLGDASRDTAAEPWKVNAPKQSSRPITDSALLPVNESDDTSAFLRIRNLTITTGVETDRRVLVNDLSLDLERGETLGLVGESGSGKTLTSLALMGLLPAGVQVETGVLYLDEQRYDLWNVASLKPLRGRQVAMIFQEPMAALDPCFTIEHHLVQVLRIHSDLSRSEAKQRAIKLLETVKIREAADVVKRYPHQISGGMAQRVGIARALAANPQVILADEPTTALDVTVQEEILDLMYELSVQEQVAMIFVTHDWGVVADICDRALVLYHGHVMETAPVLDIFENPQHIYTQALLASNPQKAPVGEPLPTVQDTLQNMTSVQDLELVHSDRSAGQGVNHGH